MKTPLILLLSLTFLFLFLTGFNLGGFVDNVRFKGTSVGVTKCVERNKQEGVPHQLIKRRCVDENQKKLENDVVAGSSGYESIYTNYSGTVENKTNDKIITSFEIHVSHDDNIDSSGKKITEIIPFEIWILPNQSKKIYRSDLKFHPKQNRLYEGEGDSRKFFYSVSFQNVKGVDFILK
jgi:hypothetical protein